MLYLQFIFHVICYSIFRQCGKMDNESCIKYNFKKDYSVLEDLLMEWYNSIDSRALCLAISRKAPRLLEWCSQNFKKFEDNNFCVITELAIPFVDITELGRSCVIVDEAIYHGTTFRKVTSIAESICCKSSFPIKAMPVVVTEEALLSKEIRSHIQNTTVINQTDCPFFINTIISKFLTLGKPYDIEFPLFYVKFDHSITTQQIKDLLKELSNIESNKKKLNKEKDCCFYETRTLSREKDKYYSSFSYLTEYLYKGRLGRNKPEFSKLRFFYKDDVLCIASMSPYILSSDDLIETNGMLLGDLQKIWKKIYHSIRFSNIDNEEYLYQVKKSLVVMTNYLLSFANFISIKDSLEQTIFKLGLKASSSYRQLKENMFYLDIKDLTCLVGREVAEMTLPYLKRFLTPTSQMEQIIIPSPIFGDIQYNLIPLDYRNAYETQQSCDNLRSSNYSTSAMVSSMFSAMHSQIELPSRVRRSTFDRLRFGETYRSIMNRLSLYSEDKLKLYQLVHECLDKRIDAGSVVPNYIRRDASFGGHYWLRMFRSGENEDFNKDMILREIIAIIKLFLRHNNGTILHRYDFEFLIALLGYDQRNETFNNFCKLLGCELRIIFDHDLYMYKSCIRLEDGKMKSLIEYAKDYQIIDEDEQHFLKLSDDSFVRTLSDGNIWTTNEEFLVDSYVSFIHHFSIKNAYPLFVRETLNYIFYKELDFEGDFQKWIIQLKEEINTGHYINLEEKEKEFKVLYERIPEPFLKLNIGENYKNTQTGIAIRKSIDINRKKVLNQSILEKMNLSYYILNLWSYYINIDTAHNFNIDDYQNCFDYLLIQGFKFDDDEEYMYLWLKEKATFDGIRQVSLQELQSHLSQILDKLMITKID